MAKLNMMDIFLLIFLVLILGAVVYKFGFNGIWGSSKDDGLLIELYQEEVPEYVAKSIKVGDIVIENVQSAEFGKVTEIKTGKSVSWAQTSQGQFVASSKEGYASIYITVKGIGKYTDRGVKIGSGTYLIGKSLDMKVANTAFYPKIYSIKRTEKEK
ncbi:MAG: DUF4330 domain-containing protein [Clostridia bacterium]|nr:DUF4330 domain-containing protein [Clostridia bacterium]